MTYEQFIQKKQIRIEDAGFDVSDDQITDLAFDFQRYVIKLACKRGRFAIFAECGMGKTLMQLEWARLVSNHTDGPVLILCPLAVSGQTIAEGVKFGVTVERYVSQTKKGIYILNYENLEKIDTSIFSGIVLDESSILKNFQGALKAKIIESFASTNYKLACTATPSPNDYMELGNHSEFLGKMLANEMLAMFFVHDGGETQKWRLKGHAEKTFWGWVASWAIVFGNPRDIGFNGDKFVLPDLNMIERQIKTGRAAEGRLFADGIVNATNFNNELRLTKIERLSDVSSIVNSKPNEQFLIWIKQNEEGEYLSEMIPDAIEVSGSESPELKEKKLLAFANNEYRVLITKTQIARFGLNFQSCHNQIFASLDFSFESTYQAIRRSYRFGQKHDVNIYIITTDTMDNVISSINQKEKQFKKMQHEMTVNTIYAGHQRINREYEFFKNDNFEFHLGDCVQLIKSIPGESIGFSVFSPPFAELYTYSDEPEDMGNSKDYNEFLFAFKFLVNDLYRVLKQGRNVAVHCMDLPIQKGKEGFIGLRDFSGMILKVFEDAGFVYHSRVTIWKNPVTEMQRTKALGLLHKQVKKDSTMSRVGIPDYVLVFRKDGERNNPVNCNISVETWQKWASPVWMDIDYSDTLNAREARDNKDEKHIAPLQLQTIERLIGLYSNEGDVVYTPFGGIGSEVYKAIEMGRYGIGHELKKSYFDTAVKNCKAAVSLKNQLELF